MERTEFQQMMAEMKEKSERRRYDALRKKYAVTPDFTNMSLREELEVRNDLDDLEQFNKKYGFGRAGAIDKALTASANVPPVQQPAQYGDATAKELDKYLESYTTPKWPEYFGPLTPYIDFGRNYWDMRTKNLEPSDKFFHCKANYEATSRGEHGERVATQLGRLRETADMLTGESTKDAFDDSRANYRGRSGFKRGLTLQEACPTHYKNYK